MPANNFPNFAESMSEEIRASLEEQLRAEAKRLAEFIKQKQDEEDSKSNP